jgi:Acetyltransferase (GNAT) domain
VAQRLGVGALAHGSSAAQPVSRAPALRAGAVELAGRGERWCVDSIVAVTTTAVTDGDGLVEVEPARWDAVLGQAGVTDVYYSRGFLAASAVLVDGAPVLLELPGQDGSVLFACLLRREPPDVVSPYGYGGPVGAGPDPPLERFPAAYEAWCRARGAVSSFVVFHPLTRSAESPASALFRRIPLGATVAWPLTGRDLFDGMHRHHRRLVRRAEGEGLEVTIDPAPTELVSFVALYETTMRRARASTFYFFPARYWRALLSGVALVRVDVRRGGRLLASVLGMGRPPWLHYHLGARSEADGRAGASHLALYRLAAWGRAHGFQTLHLGGGVGGREDSLFEFKLRFAPDGRMAVAIGKAVHDTDRYRRLAGVDVVDWDGFFPAYREPY